SNLGAAYLTIGKPEQAITAFRRALAIRPNYAAAFSNMLMAMLYDPHAEPRVIAEAHREWNHRFAAPLRSQIRPHSLELNPDRPLRIGYVSPDFREHAVRYFIEPILAAHDHAQFHITCYSTGTRRD